MQKQLYVFLHKVHEMHYQYGEYLKLIDLDFDCSYAYVSPFTLLMIIIWKLLHSFLNHITFYKIKTTKGVIQPNVVHKRKILLEFMIRNR